MFRSYRICYRSFELNPSRYHFKNFFKNSFILLEFSFFENTFSTSCRNVSRISPKSLSESSVTIRFPVYACSLYRKSFPPPDCNTESKNSNKLFYYKPYVHLKLRIYYAQARIFIEGKGSCQVERITSNHHYWEFIST